MAGEFARAGKLIVDELAALLEKGAAEIMDAADILVPKDTETLRESKLIEPARRNLDSVSVTMGFGFGGGINPKTHHAVDEYTVPVHEIMEAHHEPPTSAKFLERPLMDYASTMEKDISAELRITWGKSL